MLRNLSKKQLQDKGDVALYRACRPWNFLLLEDQWHR